jgi:hypothetical protein
MYLELHWKLAVALVVALLLWSYRPLFVRKMATGVARFDEPLRGGHARQSGYAASS